MNVMMNVVWKVRISEDTTKKKTCLSWKKLGIAMILMNALMFIYFWTGQIIIDLKSYEDNFYETVITDYIINNSKCKIPKFKLWDYEVRRLYRNEFYIPCSRIPLLTFIEKNETHALLKINETVKFAYSKAKISCCFSYVTRADSNTPDNNTKQSACISFENQVILTKNMVTVHCYDEYSEIYSNAHAFFFPYQKMLERKVKYDKLPPNVLLVGIDSISSLNMQRVLKNTHDYLEANDWIGYQVYNKIQLNTFPNMMAILTGLGLPDINKTCCPLPHQAYWRSPLDKCHFIWDDFKKFGYVTAFAEDCARINTFNYYKTGFINEPTDFYFRPYVMATDRLPKSDGSYCTGPEVEGERILNLIKDFVSTFENHPTFGFFWTSSFSHDDSMLPQRMDKKIMQLMQFLELEGVLTNTLVVFLSDHGIRFSGTRLTTSGWFEERLPFIYFWLPQWFRKKYQNETENLIANSKRLTTPFDLHMTFQHFMVLAGLNHTIKQSLACPKCNSLFQEIDEVRSCKDASIDEEWCACMNFQPYSAKSSLAKAAAVFAIANMHYTFRNISDYKNCENVTLRKVLHSSFTDIDENRTRKFMVMFETVPKMALEATLALNFQDGKPVFHPIGLPKRVNHIGHTGDCMNTGSLHSLCYCKTKYFMLVI